MLAMAATTAESRATMNHAARFAVCGEGWVIPMVLMKAFEMSRRRFISFEPEDGFRIAESYGRGASEGESAWACVHLL